MLSGLEARDIMERTVERVGLEEKRDPDQRQGYGGFKRDPDQRQGYGGFKRDPDQRQGYGGFKRES